MTRKMMLMATMCLVALGAAGEVRSGNAEVRVQSPAAVDLQSIVNSPSSAVDGAEAITIPQMLSYQGKLTDTLGQPVEDTLYAVRFRLYAQPTGGTHFWEENQNVSTTGGLFSVLLGAVTPIGSVPAAGALYLGMAVGGGAELVPRLRIVSAAYSYKADTANYALSGAGGGGDNAWVRIGSDSVLYTIRQLGIARGGIGNALLGTYASSHTNLGGSSCTTGTTGQNYTYVTVGGGVGNAASGNVSTIAGGLYNRASRSWTTVGGGNGNSAGGRGATVVGGVTNVAGDADDDTAATVAGGYANKALSRYSSVGGGRDNAARGDYSVVGGGYADTVKARYGAVLSGYHNVAGDAATDTAAVTAGGYGNAATEKYSFVGGGQNDTASGNWSTVAGGLSNVADTTYGTVGGGYNNAATGYAATVGGGYGNAATGYAATVGGGYFNDASDYNATVGGGLSNSADTTYATVGGGWGNYAAGNTATVGGGYSNLAESAYATVGGGYVNFATGYAATIGGGYYNNAVGYAATIPGGYECGASGPMSFAAGTYAKARGAGSFVWSDSCDATDSVRTATDNRWMARARGGVYFYTSLNRSTGSYLSAGGSSWQSISDSMTKENFRPVDKTALLEALARMQVRDYNLKTQDASIRHIGPVAQDFYSAFGFGESSTAINMEDADGVLMAAVQALHEQNQMLSGRIDAQQAEIEALKAELKRR